MPATFQVTGNNPAALFTLKIQRGERMALLAMNWRDGTPPDNFVGFAIEYTEPGSTHFGALRNRLHFPGATQTQPSSSLQAPFQRFHWVHFPQHAELNGTFTYRVKPVFMDGNDGLSYGEAQTAELELGDETYPGQLNVGFTRGFISSQAFVERYGSVSKLLPPSAAQSLDFVPTHPKHEEALAWMGFEARQIILDVLRRALADAQAQARVVAYDLNEPVLVGLLEQLGPRLHIIIDNSNDHGDSDSPETRAAARLAQSAGADHVKRQHMGSLQHNKTVLVESPNLALAVCGSTNFSWRGFFVQSNNALLLQGPTAIEPFRKAFESYWQHDEAAGFSATPPAKWTSLGLEGIHAKVAFSPHSAGNALLDEVARDLSENAHSSVIYSLAFLYETSGAIRDAVQAITARDDLFVCGISDKQVGGLDVTLPSGNVAPVFPAALSGDVPEPFKSEPIGGSGTRMHHKFIVIDFDKPSARVYLGSYNFSPTADTKNGENLLLIRDRRVVMAYAVEALRMFDHYYFRVKQQDADQAQTRLELKKPPRAPGELPWWSEDYTNVRKIRERTLFA